MLHGSVVRDVTGVPGGLWCNKEWEIVCFAALSPPLLTSILDPSVVPPASSTASGHNGVIVSLSSA